MSYNVAPTDLDRTELPSLVTDMKKGASIDEHIFVELAGQCLHVLFGLIPADAIINFQAYGSNVPSQGTGTFYLSVNFKPSKSSPIVKAAEKPWTPDQGPLALRTPTEDSPATG